MLSAAEKYGLTSFLAAAGLAPIDAALAALVLLLFVLICAAAPFFPRYSFFLPVVSHGNTGRRATALTFDDGPDPETTPRLLRLLAQHRVCACFFVNGDKAERHPDLVKQILAHGHDIGNHTYSHDNLIMLKSSDCLKREIELAQAVLKGFGIEPLAFRPPVGVTNPKLRGVLASLGMYTLTFNCRAGDRGNRDIGYLARRILARVRPDSIIALHDVRPRNGIDPADWLAEVDWIIRQLQQQGYEILPLSALIGRAVMRPTDASKFYIREDLPHGKGPVRPSA